MKNVTVSGVCPARTPRMSRASYHNAHARKCSSTIFGIT